MGGAGPRESDEAPAAARGQIERRGEEQQGPQGRHCADAARAQGGGRQRHPVRGRCGPVAVGGHQPRF
eukprot:6323988-Prymnesium_polylepis.1